MKLNFVYSSLSGNTKRLAFGLHNMFDSSSIMSVDDYYDNESDIYVLCSWIDKAKPDEKSINIAKDFNNKNVYLIATLGASPQSDHGKECINNMKETYSQANIIGVDLVQGSVSDNIINMFKKLSADHPHALTQEKLLRYEEIKGRPNENDIEKAYNKIKHILDRVKL